ncbi:MAG: LytTR family DNA-binding domain-containing protein [Treponema sp.]|nr:LytTR family DNA-binding domain-containing protein [Treponema sp.]
MNILICDDIKEEALKLEEAIKTSGLEANLITFNNGADVLSYIKKGVNVDICFLDIIMPEIDGIELARKLRKENYNGKIIFLTSSNDYSTESYQVKAYFYLLKPPCPNEVKKILEEISTLSHVEDTAGLPVTNRKSLRFIYFHEISYIEVISPKVYFYLLDGSTVIENMTLNEILPHLTMDGRLAQCHRSYVVNMDSVSHINAKEAFLRCGKKIPIARSNKEFSKKYFERIFKEKNERSFSCCNAGFNGIYQFYFYDFMPAA